MLNALALLLAAWLTQLPAAPPATDEEAIRLAVQQYYEAQGQRDPDKTLAFWSARANPRPGREAFLAVFGEPAEDTFTVDVRALTLKGSEARVRVLASRTRLIMRNGMPFTQRANFLNSQRWTKEAGGWKLLRDGPFAEELADDLIAAAPADRPAFLEEHKADLVPLRLAVSQRATMAITLGRNYVEGKALFELALEVSRAATDRRGETNSLHNIAQAAFFLRDLAGAADAYEKELAIGRQTGDDNASAGALFGLATVAYSRAEYTPALGLYREALAVYEKNEDGSAIGRTVVSIGNVQFLQAEYDAAIASYRRGLEAMLASGDLQGASFARSGLGRVLAAQGDIAAALDMYGQVLADARTALRADPRLKEGVAAPLESIGELYYRLGNVDQARSSFEEARTLLAADPVSVARLSADLGLTEIIAQKFDAALTAYTLSRTKYEQANDAAGIARAWVGIGFSHAAREKWTDAMAAYRTAIRLFDDQKLVEEAARAWLGLSLAQSGNGDHAAALESARKVAGDAERVHSADLVWRAAVRSGDALRRLSRLDDARSEFQRAIDAIDALAADAPVNPEVRTQLDDSAGAWAGLAFVAALSGDGRGALNAVEARRAHIRRIQLAPFQRDVSRGMTGEEISAEQAIVRDLISVRAQLRAERGLAHPNPERVEKLQQQLDAAISQRREQQARLYERLPELRQWRGLQFVAPDALSQVVADARDIAIEYLLGDDEILAVTIVRGEQGPDVVATVIPLKRHDLTSQAAVALQPAALQDRAEWRTRAAPLAAALLVPIAARLADHDRVLIVPDDALWNVPFEALPSGDGVLGGRAEVTYATSLATLTLQQAIAASRPASDAVAAALFSAPQIPAAIRTQMTLAQTGWKEPDEQRAIATAGAAAKSYDERGTLKMNTEASEAAARASMATADVLHFAGPVQASGAAPLLSMIVLSSNGQSPDSDGRWELREWFNASARPRIVVLADGGSFGAPGAGSAMDAFAWAAAAAGVPALAVARWPAGGFATDDVILALHAQMAKGVPPADALRTAAIAARRKNGEAPAGWTGLRLIGAGR